MATDEIEFEQFVFPRWTKIVGVLMVLLIAGAISFAVFEPIQVLPRMRLAPGYSLTTADGTNLTSEDARGAVTLYSFAPLECDAACQDVEATIREIRDRATVEVDLEVPLRFVTVVLDPEAQPEDLGLVAARSGADGQSWSVVGGEARELETVVGAGFRRYIDIASDGTVQFDPGYVLVDGVGVVRGDYRYQTLSDDADKMIRHIDILATELRHADGATAVAYEAAHLFLCYP
jgi:protein SCO1/2